MRFAHHVFLAAGIFGLILLPPFYFLEGFLGWQAPPPITHPEFYYGFIGATLPWQVAYLLIARDPGKFRPLMPLAILAKGSFVIAVLTLFAMGRVPTIAVFAVGADLLFVVLFARAYQLTSGAPRG